jgi:hypothetical protein
MTEIYFAIAVTILSQNNYLLNTTTLASLNSESPAICTNGAGNIFEI